MDYIRRIFCDDLMDVEDFTWYFIKWDLNIIIRTNYKVDIKELSNPSFDIKILATAAPSCYAELIAKHLRFDVCLATDFSENGFSPDFENLQEQKKKNLLKVLSSTSQITIFLPNAFG